MSHNFSKMGLLALNFTLWTKIFEHKKISRQFSDIPIFFWGGEQLPIPCPRHVATEYKHPVLITTLLVSIVRRSSTHLYYSEQ